MKSRRGGEKSTTKDLAATFGERIQMVPIGKKKKPHLLTQNRKSKSCGWIVGGGKSKDLRDELSIKRR